MRSVLFKRNQLFLLSATSIGGMIEWYELFLFIHWNDLFSKMFFKDHAMLGIYNVLFVFFVGFLGRPVGAILFGDIGDRFGRKLAFTGSIALMVLPSLLIGSIGWILPATGIGVAVTLCILRFIQGMAAGAELPGAMCYLAECAVENERSFICSFSLFGPHLGILLSQLECYIFETQLSQQFIETYGWRLSFMCGGILAFIAVLYRHRLNESTGFQLVKEKKQLSKNPVTESICKHWKKLLECFFGSLIAVVSFFMITIFVEVYLHSFVAINRINGLLISIFITSLSTFTLPLWGKLGNRYTAKRLLIWSTIGILLLSLSLSLLNGMSSIILISLFILICINIQSALLPCYIVELFPTAIRYTAIALSFSLCDSLIGGGVPWLGGLLVGRIGIKSTFIIFTSISAIISLMVFVCTKQRIPEQRY